MKATRQHAANKHKTGTGKSTKPPSTEQAKPAGATRRSKLSPLSQPDHLDVREWQTALRREFGRTQSFKMKNIGDDPLFSDFRIHNPESGGEYIVSIRGSVPGSNRCTCPDFSTNQLGTCKHIEFTLAELEKRRGASKRLQAGLTLEHSEVGLEYAEDRHVILLPGRSATPAFKRLANAYFDEKNQWRLRPEKLASLDDFVRQAGKTQHILQIRDDAAHWLSTHRDRLHRQARLKNLFPQGAHSKSLQQLLHTRLYPYQAEGVLFAVQSGRCLIGDEMGLGKTVQAIGAASVLRRHFGAERILIVCPTSLKHQWQKELQRFSGMESLPIQGPRHIREEQFANAVTCKIINYELVHRDVDLIREWAPDILIIDEAQRVKNWNTLAARALRRIETPYVFVLTGTPLENKLEELISLVQLVDRHRLGALWQLRDRHQVRDEKGRVSGYRALDEIAIALAPIMIRRRKSEVLLQLPERIEQTLYVEMTPRQQQYHHENNEIVASIAARWQRLKYLTESDQRRLSAALQNMRMACDSSFLLDGRTRDGAKLAELLSLLDEILVDPTAKVVVFSQWLRMHELISDALNERKWGHVLFHGGVPGKQRGALTERFQQDDQCRLFLSTDAGAAGLNLQNAATVINMDLPWNPAVLAQRIGRAHRLGQKNTVQVINFVAKGTIEEGMLSLLSFKKSLADGILDGGNTEVFLKGSRLNQFMASVTQVTRAMSESGEPMRVEDSKPSDILPPQSPAIAPATPISHHASGPLAPALTQLMHAGMQLLEQLNRADKKPGAGPSWLATDAQTGQRYIKIDLPDPALLEHAAVVLRKLLPASGEPS